MFMTEIIFVLGPNSLSIHFRSYMRMSISIPPTTPHTTSKYLSLFRLFFLPSVYLHYELIKPHFSILTTLSFYLSSSHLRKIRIAFHSPLYAIVVQCCVVCDEGLHGFQPIPPSYHSPPSIKLSWRNVLIATSNSGKNRVKIALLSTWELSLFTSTKSHNDVCLPLVFRQKKTLICQFIRILGECGSCGRGRKGMRKSM